MIHATDRDLALWQGGLDHAKPRKYHNTPTELDGHKFDSKAEAARYAELALLERAGKIANLQVHPKFIIVDEDDHGGFMRYEADFMYMDWQGDLGEITVEDVKGGRATQTPLWRLKWRLVQARYPHYTFKVVTR
jgi:hypothetical protein